MSGGPWQLLLPGRSSRWDPRLSAPNCLAPPSTAISKDDQRHLISALIAALGQVGLGVGGRRQGQGWGGPERQTGDESKAPWWPISGTPRPLTVLPDPGPAPCWPSCSARLAGIVLTPWDPDPQKGIFWSPPNRRSTGQGWVQLFWATPVPPAVWVAGCSR